MVSWTCDKIQINGGTQKCKSQVLTYPTMSRTGCYCLTLKFQLCGRWPPAGAIWEEGALRPARQLPGSLYGTKNGWITHGNDASDSAGSHRTNGAPAPVDVVWRSHASDKRYFGTHAPLEQFEEHEWKDCVADGCINRKMTENAGREFYPSPGVACSTDAVRRQLLYFLRRHKFISNLNYCLNVNWMPWIRSQLFSQAVDCIFYCIGTEISFWIPSRGIELIFCKYSAWMFHKAI